MTYDRAYPLHRRSRGFGRPGGHAGSDAADHAHQRTDLRSRRRRPRRPRGREMHRPCRGGARPFLEPLNQRVSRRREHHHPRRRRRRRRQPQPMPRPRPGEAWSRHAAAIRSRRLRRGGGRAQRHHDFTFPEFGAPTTNLAGPRRSTARATGTSSPSSPGAAYAGRLRASPQSRPDGILRHPVQRPENPGHRQALPEQPDLRAGLSSLIDAGLDPALLRLRRRLCL